MRLPRDISGSHLAHLLEKYGYRVSRQTGSHIRLTTNLRGEHHVTIPAHDDLRVGTLHAILRDIADHLDMQFDGLVEALFEQ